METKHTPLPWITNGYRSPISGITVFNKPFGLGDICHVYTNEHDARLIAAAPDLLAIAQRVAALNENAGDIGPGMLVQLVTDARALVIKATE